MERSVSFLIDPEIYKKFKIALLISGDEEGRVVQELLQSYTKATYANAADSLPEPESGTVKKNEHKAVRKIPIWATRPASINHQILKAFLAVRDVEQGVAMKSKMWECFSNSNTHSYSSFNSSFNSMLTDSGNSNGKTFERAGDIVQLFEPVKDVVEQYESYFIG